MRRNSESSTFTLCRRIFSAQSGTVKCGGIRWFWAAAFEAVRCIAENQYALGYGRVPARIDLSDADITDYIENGMVPTYKATDDIPAEQFKAAWFDADRKVLSEKVVGTADTTISQIWTSEAPLYGMGQQDLDTTMKNIFSRSNEAIKEAELY